MRCLLSRCLEGNLQLPQSDRVRKPCEIRPRPEARAPVPCFLLLSSHTGSGIFLFPLQFTALRHLLPQLVALLREELLLDCVPGGGDEREGDEARSSPREIWQEQGTYEISRQAPSVVIALGTLFMLSWSSHCRRFGASSSRSSTCLSSDFSQCGRSNA